MTGDKNNWREKYLTALDEQEQLEQKFAQQQALLRRALVRISLAADGQDDVLDSILQQLRDTARDGLHVAELSKILEPLEQATLALEAKREQGARDIATALHDALAPFENFKVSKNVARNINDFLAQLPQRSKRIHLYPAMLQQLANIQQQVLADIAQPKAGLLDKILGAKPEKNPAQEFTHTEEIATEKFDSRDEKIISPAHAQEAEKPGYVQDLIKVLDAFCASLESDDALKSKVQRVRHELNGKITAEALVHLLESMHSMVLETYIATREAFASYLKNVNDELAEIYALLGGAVKHSQNEREASRKLQDDMMREMGALESSAANATDLNELKHKVKSQLGSIRQVIDQHQHVDQAQQQLTRQLETLGAKIKFMEVEAEKNRTTLEIQRKKAQQDPLTELPNREAYNERAHEEVQRWLRYGRPLSLAIVDIDHFKRINDTFGHQAGDRVIKVIGRSIATRLRDVDFICRYGGEEFVVLLPETRVDSALEVMEHLREVIAKAAFNYKEKPLKITVSIGVTEFMQGDDLQTAFERADQALYAAKSGGRNLCQRL